MIKKFSVSNLYQNITLVLLLLAIAINAGAGFNWFFNETVSIYDISHIQQAFPEADSYSNNLDNSTSVYDANSQQIGKAIISSEIGTTAEGYAGSLPILISINNNNNLGKVILLKNDETKKIIDFLDHKDFYNTWSSIPLDSNVLNLSIDAVSGATITSNAIINGVNNTLASFLAIEQQKSGDWKKIVQLISILILIIISVLMIYKQSFKKYYYYHLAGVLLILGFWVGKMLSVDIFFTWLKNGLPWYNNSELVVIFLISIMMALIGRKKYYCNYLCPMGALQILTSKLSPFKKRKLPQKILNIDIRSIYLSFIWAGLICGLSIPLSSMEPFMAFAYEVSGLVFIAFGVLIIVLSMFYNRPWCNFCPTGCALDSVSQIKTNR